MERSNVRAGVIAAAIALSLVTPASAGMVYVNDDAPAGGNGQSWATAYRFLQDALTAARNSGGSITEIWVAAGTYKPDRDAAHPTGTGSRTATFQLITGVALRGGFAGNEAPSFDLNARDFRANKSTLSGDLAGNDGPNFANNAENSNHVVTGTGTGPTAILDGFIISAGNGTSGAGLYNNGSGSPGVRNCTFSANQAPNGGAAVYNNTASPSFVNCVFTGNNGSAVYCSSACAPSLVSCTFGGNTGTDIVNQPPTASTVTLTNCIVWGNGPPYGSATVTHSCIQGGWAGVGNINADPRFVCPAAGNLHLRRGSPCIDAGNTAALPVGTLRDADGNLRLVDDPDTPDMGNPGNPPCAVVDMGAYEYQPVAAEKLYVNDDAAAGGDGTSWATAFRFLRDALNSQSPGLTEIWVAGGVYKADRDAAHPNGTGDRAAIFQLLGGVSVYGGFPGQPGQEGDFSVRNPAAFETLLSGDLAGNDGPNFANNGENSLSVVKGSATGPGIVLDGLTISGAAQCGMVISYGSPSVKNCKISGNRGYIGGGVYICDGSPTFENCSFTGNNAEYGAGVNNYIRCTSIFKNCVFRGNSVTVDGGGIYNGSSSNQTLINCVFSGNSASRGGGIHCDGTQTLVNCTLAGNSASTECGGVYCENESTTTLTGCIVAGNTGGSPNNEIHGTATVTYSCIRGGSTGQGNIAADPELVSASSGDLRLRRGSPCIDAGSNSALPLGTSADVAGNPRFVDDPDTPDTGTGASPIVDMGAYEYQPGSKERLFVNAAAPAGGDGASWVTAYQYLQDALSAAQSRLSVSEIWVAAGTYKPDRDAAHPSGTGDRLATFQLITGVAVRGGFTGNEDPATFDLATRDFEANACILSGDLAGDDGPNFANNAENSVHVVTGTNTSPAAVLDGFKVTAGYACGSSVSFSGAGLYMDLGSPTLSNCAFTGNMAGSKGGAIYNSYGNPVVTNCLFSGNSCIGSGNNASHGGGVYSTDGNLVFRNCTFNGNSATATYGGGRGGGMYVYHGNASLANCIFSINSATGDSINAHGGGIYIDNNSNLTMANCSFSGNSAQANGGGLSCVGGNRSIISCSFSNNSANRGGGVYEWVQDLRMTNCTFRGNSALLDGGGLCVQYLTGSCAMTNCTFTANSAVRNGAGIYNYSNSLSPVNCTIAGNLGHGIWTFPFTMNNCILWGNTGAQIANATSANVTYSCVQGGWTGTGNISADPLFVNAGAGDYSLSAGSPCIDAGKNAAVPADTADLDSDGNTSEPIPLDLAGQPRFFDDTGTPDCPYASGTCGTTPIVDMGAYEFGGTSVLHRTVSSWASVRTHAGAGPVAISLDTAAPAQTATLEPRLGGIQNIQVTFDGSVSVSDASKITVISGASSYTPTLSTAGNVLSLAFSPGTLPDQQCYTISIGAGAFGQIVEGKLDCNIKALVGDVNDNGMVNLGDMLYVRSQIGQAVTSGTARFDLDLSGAIDMADVLAMKSLVTSPARQMSCP